VPRLSYLPLFLHTWVTSSSLVSIVCISLCYCSVHQVITRYQIPWATKQLWNSRTNKSNRVTASQRINTSPNQEAKQLIEECRLLEYKTPVRTSQETHYVSVTDPSWLLLCKIWGFHGGDYEDVFWDIEPRFIPHRRHINLRYKAQFVNDM
jgi:hypothetical protein